MCNISDKWILVIQYLILHFMTGLTYNEMTYEDRFNRLKLNVELIDPSFKDYIKVLESQFNINHTLLWNHWSGTQDFYVPYGPCEQLIMQSLFKSQDFLFASSVLVRQGLYGSARVLFRPAFEYLLIGKFIAISQNDRLAEKWFNLDPIHVTNHLLNRISNNDLHEIRTVYSAFHKFTHATSGAGQVKFEVEDLKPEIHHDLLWIMLLLTFNYHLLNSHFITGQLRYRSKVWFGKEQENKDLRLKAREQKKWIIQNLSSIGKKLRKEYTASWTIK